MTEFLVSGPHVIPIYQGKNGRIVREEEGREFFRHHPSLSSKRGCYMFAMRTGRGLTPSYIGKATKTFKQECFTAHKLGKCNQTLVDYGRGTLVMFLFEAKAGRGKAPISQIKLLEDFLIQTAVSVNEDLLNIKSTKQESWSIRGIIRSTAGKPSQPALDAKRALGL
jgi:hypothetical protein